jgi:hypothetical protein
MTSRDRILLLVLLGAGLMAGFWFGVLAPKRSELAKLSADIRTEEQRLDQAKSAAAQSRAAKARYESDYETVARLGKAVPVDDDVPSLVYQLEDAADGAKIDFRSIKLSAGATPKAETTPAAPAAAATGKSTAAGTGASTAPATAAAAATLPPGASVGPAGFPTMPFAFTFDGSFFSMERFLRNVQQFIRLDGEDVRVRGRLLAIDGISLTASSQGFPRVKASLSATAYLVPAEQGLTGGATPQGPATTTTAAAPAAAGATAGGASASATTNGMQP